MLGKNNEIGKPWIPGHHGSGVALRIFVVLGLLANVLYNTEFAARYDQSFVASAFENQTTQIDASTFDVHPVSWVNDMNMDKPSVCGYHKCLYESKRNPRHGYLVSQPKGKWQQFGWHKEGWGFAEELRKSFGIRHLLLAAPRKVRCIKFQCYKKLNRHTYPAVNHKMEFMKPYVPNIMILFAQPVEIAEAPTFTFGTNADKYEIVQNELEAFVDTLNISDVATMEANLRSDTAATIQMLKATECMRVDFQVLLDRNGRMYHLDFDRCFNVRRSNPTDMKKCKWRLNAFVDKFVELVAKRNLALQKAL